MSRKPKKVIAMLLCMLLAVMMLPQKAQAAGRIKTEQQSTLTIDYKDEGKAIFGAHFSVYKVADRNEYGEITLAEKFEKYQNSVRELTKLNDLTGEEWNTLAETLRSYVLADGLRAEGEGDIDETGETVITDLSVGLYLVIGSKTMTSDYFTYEAVPFMVLLPGSDTAGNDWDYDILASPKFSKEYTPDLRIDRKVIKIWDDSGYESLRPEEVEVTLLKDGVAYDTQKLNKDNDWRYTWEKLDPQSEWLIVEKEMEGYAVSIDRTGITFTVTNKFVAPITVGDPPVQKRVIGEKPDKDGTFVFVLSANDPSYPMPPGSSGTVKETSIVGPGVAEFGSITFTKPGVYTYTVYEKNTGEEGYSYDSTVYIATFIVVQEDGELVAARKIEIVDGTSADVAEFTNEYKKPGGGLPYTGVLWWPVPVLFGAGLLTLILGIIRRKKCS